MPRAEAQRLAPRVELIDLVALDAADFEPEAVRSEIDDGEQRVGFLFGHAGGARSAGAGVRRVAEISWRAAMEDPAACPVVIWTVMRAPQTVPFASRRPTRPRPSGRGSLEPMKSPSPLPINRELSQLAFNRRVLTLAQDPATPLLERLRFLCIVSNNLDEFFEIRVAGLKEQMRARLPPPGMTLPGLRALLGVISDETRSLVAEQYRLLNDAILPALAAAGIRLLRRDAFDSAQRAWVSEYFQREVRPLLTPIGLDPAHPFPQVANKSLNFVVELSGRDAFGRVTTIATVKAPRLLPRVIALPRAIAGSDNAFVLLSSVIHTHLHELFGGRDIIGYSQFRVTRDADLWFDEEEVKNLRQALEGELPQRHFGQAVRLEVAAGCPAELAAFLLRQFELDRRRSLSRRRTGQSRAHGRADRRRLRHGARLPAVRSGLARPPPRRARLARHDPAAGCPVASSVPVVRSGRRVHPQRQPTTRMSWRSSRRSTEPASIRC
jgi:hypothetical protein